MLPARLNPYRVQCIESLRFRFPPGDSMGQLLERLDTAGGRGAIIGPHGSGKTTLMQELVEALEARGLRVRHHRLTQTQREVPSTLLRGLGPTDALLLDSAGLLGWLAWRRVRQATGRVGVLVVTAHHTGAAGRLPTLIRCTTGPVLLAQLLHELHGREVVDPQFCARLHAQCRGNVREAFRWLYDAAADPDTTTSAR